MCGVFGVQKSPNSFQYTLLGLYALQHRGEEAAGIVSFFEKNSFLVKGVGLVQDVFKKKDAHKQEGKLSLGHVRYSTTGSNSSLNVQPFVVHHKGFVLAVVHNGNLINTKELSSKFEKEGSIIQTGMDSELLIHAIVKNWKDGDIKGTFFEALKLIKGAYSALFMIDDILVAVRDPRGFRPLSLGIKDGSYFVSSETCAFDLIGVDFVRDIDPGEILLIDSDGHLESIKMSVQKRAYCIFEQVYFSRPDSNFYGESISFQRKLLGKQLAKESSVQADIVLAVPDSGNFAAMGFSEESKIPFEMGIVRNHYIGRTFIQSAQIMRDFRAKIKLNPIKKFLEGKKVVLVDDSIVRGTTAKMRVETLYDCGAKEIHMRVSCPPVMYPCFYGMDFPSSQELIASQKSVEEIRQYIGVDSLAYLSLDGMKKTLSRGDSEFCDACFSGTYPVKKRENFDKFILERA